MKSNVQRLTLLAGIALPLSLALSTLSLAQPAGQDTDHAADQQGAREAHQGWQRDPAAHAAHRAQRLREVLQLRSDQEDALSAYLAAIKPPQGMGEHMRQQHDADQHLTAPERMDQMLGRLDRMRALLATRAEATKRFYADLSPAQQKAFDAMGPMGGGHRHGEGGGRMGQDRDGDEHGVGQDDQPPG
ncbi:MAG: Spy/CpxP family protein refolding chaperone [Caulobacterales bacterium]